MPMTFDQALALTKKLAKQLGEDASALKRFNDYYLGRHPLAFASDRFQDAFGGMFGAFADNWCPLVVDSLRQRLHVTGFRFPPPDNADGQPGDPGGPNVADPAKGDREAWDMWQGNFLDADSDVGHTDAMVFGRSFVSVGFPPPGHHAKALITVESPMNMIVAYSADRRRNRLAALRLFTDDDGNRAATLYTPDQIWRWTQRGSSLTFGGTWELRAEPERNRLGVVPVVSLVNRPRLDPWGYSELLGVIPLQDAVNKLVTDMMVASEFVAMPQRWATGLEIRRDPVTNQPIDPFPPKARLWQLEDDRINFGQFPPASLETYVQAIELIIQHVASQSATPPHYFYLKGQFPSGESIKSAEAGLVAKATDRTRTFGETWEEVMRLAFLVAGDAERARSFNAETIWADVEVRTESAHVDAVTKKKDLGVPVEQLWEDLGYTPQQIARFSELNRQRGQDGPQGPATPSGPPDPALIRPAPQNGTGGLPGRLPALPGSLP